MKRKLFFLAFVFITTIICLQGQDCVKCDTNSNNTGDFATALGEATSASGIASFAAGNYSESQGDYSTALGKNTKATGRISLAAGLYSEASGIWSTAIGFRNISSGHTSITIGSHLHATYSHAIIIGSGYGMETPLINANSYSIMMGSNSIYPTFFISTSPEFNETGRIGIGNMTDPQAKLHIRADDGEEAAVLIEPNNWLAGEHAKLILGDSSHYISANNNTGMEFNSQNNFIFSGNNSGFGINEPKAKVHINGDLLFEQNMNGIIMKSEDGNCWKGTISNNGELQFAQIDCGTLTSIQNNKEQKHSEIFIYPNPTKGEITIEYNGNRKNLRVEFQTINGLLVATHKIKKGENKIQLYEISGQMIIASVYTRNGELISSNKVVINK